MLNQGPSQVKYVEITENSVDQRVDNFLIKTLKNIPKSKIYKIIRKGEVRVNKKRVKPEYKLQLGDTVRIPPVKLTQENKSAPTPSNTQANLIKKNIIYQDDYLLIINKPQGFAVHGGSGISLGVIETIRQLYSENPYLELVHRLDRDTSGCLLIAKKRSVLKQCHEIIKSGKINKKYIALIKGRLDKSIIINKKLLKLETKSGERRVIVSDEGKESKTQLIPMSYYKNATLVSVKLFTGRTHQIRVHCQSINQPILGDNKYGEEFINNKYEKMGLLGLFLHAESLEFTHPVTNKKIKITAPLPESHVLFLEHLDELN